MREKLIKLIFGCHEMGTRMLSVSEVERLAEHLIANGVVVPVRCSECKNKEHCRTTTVWANPPSDDWFCADGKRREAMEFKRCPFCGQQETVHLVTYAGKDGFRDRYAVLCDYVDGGCGGESGMYHSREEAIAAWNMRAEQ